MNKLSKSSKDRLIGIKPILIEIVEEAITISPIDFGIPQYGGVRTDQEQNDLFKKGVSKCDGFKIRGNHQVKPDGFGHAFDVYAYVNGKASWNNEHLAIIAGVILSVAAKKGVSLRWGGTFGSSEFKGWDRPHFELV